MSKRKQSIGEVQLEKQKYNEAVYKRRRYATMKQDPKLYELIKEKEKKRYKNRKEKLGQFESINEKSPREQRVQRKKWREAAKKYREKKKNEGKEMIIKLEPILMNPDDSDETNTNNHLDDQDPLTTPTNLECNCSVKVKSLRYSEYKKRQQLLKVIMDLKKENARLRQKVRQKACKTEELFNYLVLIQDLKS